MNDHTPYTIPLVVSSPSKFKQFLPTSEKILVFDIDNTLYCSSLGFDKVIKKKINDYAVRLGIKENIADVCSKYTKEYGLALKGLLVNYPETDPEEFFRNVEGDTNISDYIRKDEELIEIFEELKDYKMYCFTNAHYTHAMNVLNVMGLTKYFSGVFYCNYTSCGTFLCKPDVQAYKLVDNMLDNKKIYFYDDVQGNVDAGNACGWVSELINKEYNIKCALRKFIEMESKKEVKKALLSDLISARYVEGNKKPGAQEGAEDTENKA